MGPIKAKNLSEQAAAILEEKIIKFDLKPGEWIKEIKVAEDLAVSQSSIREALRILEKRGLVKIVPRKGTYVTTLSKRDIQCLYDIIALLYSLMAQRLMEKKDGVIVIEIVAIIEKIEKSIKEDNVNKYYSLIFLFAESILKKLQSPLLEKMIFELWPIKRRVEYLTIVKRKGSLHKSLTYFKKLKKYILENNTSKIEQSIKAFLENEKQAALTIISKEIYLD